MAASEYQRTGRRAITRTDDAHTKDVHHVGLPAGLHWLVRTLERGQRAMTDTFDESS
jgi:hypothetical protein